VSPLVGEVRRGNQRFRKRQTGSAITLNAPIEFIVKKLHDRKFCDRSGNPRHRADYINLDVPDILDRYNGVLHGILNYYSFVDNYSRLSWIQSILQLSAAKTLASKLRIKSVRGVFRRFGFNLRYSWVGHDGKQKTEALRLLRSFRRDPSRFHASANPVGGLYELYGRKITKSKLGSVCVICGNPENVEMHHVRHIRKSNQKLKGFHRQMALINRKQVPVCQVHHVDIHSGLYVGVSLGELIKRHGIGA
jgi:hypothetical protein